MTFLAGLLLASLPWFEGGASPFGLFLTHSLVFLMVGAAVARVARRGELRLAAGWEAAAGLAVAGLCVVSFLQVDYRFGSFLSLWNVLVAVLLVGALVVAPPRHPGMLAGVVAVSAAAQAVQVWMTGALPNMTASARFTNASQLAAYLVIGTMLSAGLCLRALRAPREEGRQDRGSAAVWIWGAMALLHLGALLTLGSRGALLSLLCAGVAWGLTSGGRLPFRRLLWAGAVALLVVSAVAVAWRFERIPDPYRFDRVRIWTAGLKAAADHPLAGMGPGMFERRGYAYNFPLDREMFRYAKTPGSVHSTWLQALVETGVPGLVAALAFAILLTRRALGVAASRDDDRIRGAGFALLACLLQGLVDMPFEVPAVTLTLLVLLTPWLTPSTPREAPLHAVWTWSPAGPLRRGAAAVALCALVCLHAATTLFPWMAHVSFERALAGRGDAQAGIARAMRLDPWNPLYPATRGSLVARRRAPLDVEALARAHLDLRRAQRIDPGNPGHLLSLAQLQARACFDLGCDHAGAARAERAYLEAIALGRKDPRPLVELASLRVSLGRPQEAIPLLDEAVRLEPRFLEAWLGLARAHLETGRLEAAARAMSGLDRARDQLRGHFPRNGYEQDLMRLDPDRVAHIARRLQPVGTGP